MPRHRLPQPIEPRPVQPAHPFDAARQLRQLLNVTPEHVEVRMDRLAELRGFPTGEAARKFVKRHGIPCRETGRRLVVDLRDFDAVCASEAAERRQRSA